jgi:hypothetical protein
MSIVTNPEALAEMRNLKPTSTGRLRGLPASATRYDPVDRVLRDTPEPWRSRIAADITDRHAGVLRAASVEYLVLSDSVLIAVLTAGAQVELPDYPLTSLQRRHQTAVAQALTDLPRHTLRQLADQRATMDGRDEQARFETHPPAATAIRVAPAGDPTVTEWVPLGPSLCDSRRDLQAAGLDPDRALILSAPRFGRYGQRRHRLDLPTLCTMCRLAFTHNLPVAVLGDWLDKEGATTTDPGVQRLRAAFTESYLGSFPAELAYTEHRIAELGWTTALANAGIPIGYLDLAKINHCWFADEVRAVRIDPGGRIAVFSRGIRHHHR